MMSNTTVPFAFIRDGGTNGDGFWVFVEQILLPNLWQANLCRHGKGGLM
jgi:hypothetical protein